MIVRAITLDVYNTLYYIILYRHCELSCLKDVYGLSYNKFNQVDIT